jgi:hypothetical protein
MAKKAIARPRRGAAAPLPFHAGNRSITRMMATPLPMFSRSPPNPFWDGTDGYLGNVG